MRALGEPLGQLVFVVGGQVVVARLPGQVQDGLRALAALEGAAEVSDQGPPPLVSPVLEEVGPRS